MCILILYLIITYNSFQLHGLWTKNVFACSPNQRSSPSSRWSGRHGHVSAWAINGNHVDFQNGWFIVESPMKMDDDWGYPYDPMSGNLHMLNLQI